jgi:hypothetical protein
MSFDVVECEHSAIAGRQLRNSLIESDSVHNWHRVWILGAFNDLHWRFAVVSGGFHSHATLAKVHKHLIDGQSVQPGRKGGLAAKASDFSKELDEDLLGKVFGLRDVAGHSETERVHAPIVTLVELLEGLHVALSGPLSQSVIGFLLCLDVGCGHVVRQFTGNND